MSSVNHTFMHLLIYSKTQLRKSRPCKARDPLQTSNDGVLSSVNLTPINLTLVDRYYL